MSDIYRLAAQYLKELNELDRRTSAVKNSVHVIIDNSDRCLNDCNRLRKIAEVILSGILKCLEDIKAMNKDLTEAVHKLNQLSREVFEIGHQINADRNDVSNLEAHYLIFKKEVETIYNKTVTIVEDLGRPLNFNNSYLVTKYLKTLEIDSFLEQQNNAFRICPEFKVPLFEPIEIPIDLLFEPSVEENSNKANRNNFFNKSTNSQPKNQQENA